MEEEQCGRNQRLILSSNTDRIEAKAIGSFGNTKITLSQGRLIDQNSSQCVEIRVEISGKAPPGIPPLSHSVSNITWKGSADDLGKIIAIGIAISEYTKNFERK